MMPLVTNLDLELMSKPVHHSDSEAHVTVHIRSQMAFFNLQQPKHHQMICRRIYAILLFM